MSDTIFVTLSDGSTKRVRGVDHGDGTASLEVVGGGSGFGDATAANQTTEITRLTSILAALPAALDASGGLKTAEQNSAAGENDSLDLRQVAIMRIANGPFGPSHASLRAGAAAAALVAAPCSVFSILATNRNTAARFLQIRNNAAGTTTGSADHQFVIAPSALVGQVTIGANELTEAGISLSVGATFSWSTTTDAHAAATGSEHELEVYYKS